jgi:hypothetical protein
MLTRRRMVDMAIGFGLGGTSLALAPTTFAQRSAYVPTNVVNGGSIEGIVRAGGNLTEAEKIIIGKDNHICGEGHRTPDPVNVSPDMGLENAVVLIKDLARGKSWPKKDGFEIVQEKCTFRPYLQITPKSFELTIVNKDPLLHNIHVYEQIGRARRTIFNIAQPQANQVDRQRVEVARGNVIEVHCDAHNWMSAWIVTADHPYVVMTDQTGRFSISDVPPGSYEMTAWHPVLGSVTARADVAARAKSRANFTFGA